MTLRLEKVDRGWRGRLNLEYQKDKDMKPESLDLADLSIGARQLVFSDSSSAGVRNRLISFAGVRQGAELTGTATTISPRNGEPPLTVLGHWILQHDPAPPVAPKLPENR
jgi:hypothetical protein